MAFIVVDNPEIDVWVENPSLGMIEEFREFRKVEGDERSSNIIKAIYYIWDPKSDLKDSGVSEEKLIEDVTTSMIKDESFDWEDYEEIKEAYLKYNISKVESLLLQYEEEIKGLNSLLESWKWNKKDIKEKAFAISQYKVLFESYMELYERAKAEADDAMEMRAGYQKSMLESLGDG